MGYKIAVVGANTMIGHEIIEILGDGDAAIETLHALTHKGQSGRALSFGHEDIITKDVATFDFSNVEIVFYADGLADAKSVVERAVNAGCQVIDASAVMTFETDQKKVTSIPHATASILIDALRPLHQKTAIKRASLTSFEATSAEGKDGMDELFNQSRKFFVSDGMDHNVFQKQIAFNVIPQIDEFMDDGMTESEWRLGAEVKKFLDKTIKTSATCVQVPVFMGHGMAVTVELADDLDARDARALWRDQDGIMVIDRESEMGCVTPAEIAGEDAVFISRIRNDATLDHALSFWVTADNIRHITRKAVAAAFSS